MTKKAKTIAAADLAKLTQAAVRKVTEGGTGRILKGPIWGYVLATDIRMTPQKQLEQAMAITKELAVGAKSAGIAGLKVEPSVILKPGKLILGFIERELNFDVQQL